MKPEHRTKDAQAHFDHYGGSTLRFRYVNWHGADHEYAVVPHSIEYAPYQGDRYNLQWQLHGHVVTRDRDPRLEMGPTRRRSFLLHKIRDLEELTP